MTKILVVAPSWIGDAILSQPLLALLKRQDPDASIDVLAPAWVLPIYRRMPEVAATLENPFSHGHLALGRRFRLGRELKNQGYDQAYVLPNSFKSALVPWFSGIPRRIGFVGELRYGLLTDSRALDKEKFPLMVERFAHLADAPDAAPRQFLPSPRLQVAESERAALISRLQIDATRPSVCLCPGAEYGPAKRWPKEYFAELATMLAAEGNAVWIIGSAKETALGEAIEHASDGAALNLCGKTSLDDAAVLLSTAATVVANDSGLMHLAAAVDRPLIAIYGSSSPSFTPPLSSRARIMKLDLACSPCFERVCPLKHFDCMMKLVPTRVFEEMKRLSLS
ncbi:MAG: lipopolysaccharide heptosyltransferase II [Burkholderiales bacterium]